MLAFRLESSSTEEILRLLHRIPLHVPFVGNTDSHTHGGGISGACQSRDLEAAGQILMDRILAVPLTATAYNRVRAMNEEAQHMLPEEYEEQTTTCDLSSLRYFFVHMICPTIGGLE